MEMIEVKRHRQTTYYYLPDRYCTFCGTKGIYECYLYDEDPVFCFACEVHQPAELNDPDHSLPLFAARAEKVVDRKEWTELMSKRVHEFDKIIEDKMCAVNRILALSLYGDGND